MGLISAATQIRIISSIHLALAYYLIFQPDKLDDQGIIDLLGQAMEVDQNVTFGAQITRPLSSFLGLTFAFIAIGDLTAAGIEGVPFYIHWGAQAPIRLLLFFVLSSFIYVYDARSLKADANAFASGLSSIKSNWVFFWAFIEIMAWFMVYTSIREERQGIFIEREREATGVE